MMLTTAWSSVSSHATACSLTANTRAQNNVVKSVATARKRWDHSCSSVAISCKTRYATKRGIHRRSFAEPRSPASCPPASTSKRCNAGRTQRKSSATCPVDRSCPVVIPALRLAQPARKPRSPKHPRASRTNKSRKSLVLTMASAIPNVAATSSAVMPVTHAATKTRNAHHASKFARWHALIGHVISRAIQHVQPAVRAVSGRVSIKGGVTCLVESPVIACLATRGVASHCPVVIGALLFAARYVLHKNSASNAKIPTL